MTQSRAADNTTWSFHAATTASGFTERLALRLAQLATPLLTADVAPNPHGGGPRPRRRSSRHGNVRQHCVASSAARVVDAGRSVAKPFGLTRRCSHGKPDHGGFQRRRVRGSLLAWPHRTLRLLTGPPRRRPPACTRVGCPGGTS